MMIGRVFALALMTAVTIAGVTIVVSLILYDFFGSDLWAKAWTSVRAAHRARVEQSGLDRARDFSFFTTTPVKGHDLEVTTGVRFKTLSDLLAARQQERWCYVLIQPAGGVPRQITLARQTGTAPPVFNDLSSISAAELRLLGVSRETLDGLARTYCRFCCAGKDGPAPPYRAAKL